MEKIRVLIIDEHTAVCRALALRLDAAPLIHVVGATCDLEEGACLARQTHPHIILLELKSSGYCGREGPYMNPGQAISQLLATGTCSIIVLTSYLDDSEQEIALFAGAKRYLLKDIDTIRLVTEIEDVAYEGLYKQE